MVRLFMAAMAAITLTTVPAQAQSVQEQAALIINLNGHLCAEVTSIRRLEVGNGNVYEVECIEYRGGAGRVRYLLDVRDGSVTKL